MIRSKHKIYGEANDPNTVIVTDPGSPVGRLFVLSSGNKGIQHILPPPNSIMITRHDGKVLYLELANQPMKVIATDSNGDIILLDRSELT